MDSLAYTVKRSPRRKTVSIRINPDKTVVILAPAGLSDARISEVALRKASWIRKQFNELDRCEYRPYKHHFAEGEIFLYLGAELKLRHTGGRGGVVIDDGFISVAIPPGLRDCRERRGFVEKQLLSYYRSRAHEMLRRRTFDLAGMHALEPHFVAVKDYTSRWGCCFADKRIYFNWKIIMAPEDIVDYVIVHELCHLRVANHSPAFWALVEKIMPDWRDHRLWLRRNGHALIF